jgi:thiamine-phosphate pyrophosphorylase
MLVTDRHLVGGEEALLTAVDQAIEGGVNAVQLREKDMPRRGLLDLAMRLREISRGRALLIVNSAADVALECEADGVHLPEDAQMIDSPLLIGRSVHSVEAAVRAEAEGADYVIAGPVFETRSHEGRRPAGLELIRKMYEVVGVPIVGIGGIDYQRAATVVRAGAQGIAVISAILAAPSARMAAAQLRDALAEASSDASTAL